jgi:bifunctional oligoribonuclease and PAP phosphatase NrnA
LYTDPEIATLEPLRALLQVPRRVVIIPHQKPDADALGSSLGLANWLLKGGHTVHVVSPTDYPRFLNWLPGHNALVTIYQPRTNHAEVAGWFAKADLIFCLDFNDLKRCDPLSGLVQRAKAKRVLIDHHEAKQDFAHFEYWRVSAAATAELIFEFIGLMGGASQVDAPIAECLYAGIMTDTGSFKYPATSSRVHRIVAHLLDLGIDHTTIHRRIYDTNSEDRLKLLGFALNNRLQVLPQHRTAYFALSKADLFQFNYQVGDAEGMVNYALSVEGVVLAALFKEEEDHVKISFRSVGDFSVNDLSRAEFNGGGHKNAAGGKLPTTLQAAVDKFLTLLPHYQPQLDRAALAP